jgi:hypothetical protein
MKAILSGVIISMVLITSCSKSSPANIITTYDDSSLLGIITVDIDGVTTYFDSVPACVYLTWPHTNDIIINGYKKNDTSRCTIQLMISGDDSLTAGVYIDSVPPYTKAVFLPSYIPPDFISSFSGDRESSLRPEIQISYIKDSIQGTFDGRLVNILYQNSLPDTTYHVLTNGKFKIRINHSYNGI